MNVLIQADALGLIEESTKAIYSSFAEDFNQGLARVDPRTRDVFVRIVITLKDTKYHIRMALVNLNWVV